MTAELKIIEIKKFCNGCKTERDISDFYKRTKATGNYQCKACEREKNRKQKFGLSYAEIERMLQNQMGLCANRGCGKEITLVRLAKNRACIDHNHTTGKVRALLCIRCNGALGVIEDKNMLFGLTEYLNKYDG